MGIVRGRIAQDEWTRFENGRPVCGVGYRGYWTNTAHVGGPFPFERRPDGSWYDPKTGKPVRTMTLQEFIDSEVKDGN
jgi:hypothetical protein